MSEAVVKQKKESGAMLVAVLTVISVITALLLGVVNAVTAPQIEINKYEKTQAAMAAVLPADGYDEVAYNGGDATVVMVYEAKGGEGHVVEVKPSGFGGLLDIMVGVDANGACSGISVISQSETPGLGAKSTDPEWASQFVGKSGEVKVTKDGGEINAITGATITSRAVSAGVTSALEAVASLG